MKQIVVHLAECVAALWKHGSKGESLPDINGIVDKAIEQVYREIPDLHKLTFSNTSIGRRCLEWPEAASYMQYSGAAEIDGATYTRLKICIGADEAYKTLYELGLSKGQRRRLSDQFYRTVERGRQAMA